MNRLQETFDLHRLEVEDCLHFDQRPKLEDYPGHQFIVIQGFSTEQSSELTEPKIHEMHAFLGKDWLLTVHDWVHPSVSLAIDRVQNDPKGTFGKGVDFIAYLVLDAIVDANFPLLDQYNDELESLETAVFERRPSPKTLRRIFGLKRALMNVRKVLSPQRDVMNLLAKRGVPYIADHTALYFRDVYDHLVRLYEQIDSVRDLLSNVMDGYLSVQANRTADVNKQLAIIATLFLPLSFVVGFFGQNFEVLSAQPFFEFMLASMVVIPILMMTWFNHKHWL
jgi:magnesium transporter